MIDLEDTDSVDRDRWRLFQAFERPVECGRSLNSDSTTSGPAELCFESGKMLFDRLAGDRHSIGQQASGKQTVFVGAHPRPRKPAALFASDVGSSIEDGC